MLLAIGHGAHEADMGRGKRMRMRAPGDGTRTGLAGGHERKRRLLAQERVAAWAQARPPPTPQMGRSFAVRVKGFTTTRRK